MFLINTKCLVRIQGFQYTYDVCVRYAHMCGHSCGVVSDVYVHMCGVWCNTRVHLCAVVGGVHIHMYIVNCEWY